MLSDGLSVGCCGWFEGGQVGGDLDDLLVRRDGLRL